MNNTYIFYYVLLKTYLFLLNWLEYQYKILRQWSISKGKKENCFMIKNILSFDSDLIFWIFSYRKIDMKHHWILR